ncbi:hypothetical protein B0A69_02330 [Chryseobacterium shigense]|uniref:Uncharacterized protein n=1 Tax=Chryseobacterium shigense TaxID=297244 RepID=A0A1N7I8Y4_9FLAO|nr:hypothetical protein [Chryseobacterium shigense]PQA96922.1 hypothetical protein B0A69_02330 [Chryseobacterium shigense]SIS33548.1 hypothetical protein SAMN05421639_102665 [Chryseobacterium shigense]
MKKVTVRKVDWKVFIFNIVAVAIPLYFIVLFAYEINDTTMQTVFIICSLSLLGFVNFIIVKKGTELVEVILKDDEMEIVDGKKTIYSSKYSQILNYNIYYFINKRGGYILRIKDKTRTFCSLITWINLSKAEDIDYQNREVILETLNNHLLGKKKITRCDYFLKILSIFPYIMLVFALLLLLGMFLYLIYL